LATNDQRTPFAVVTTFVPTITAQLPRGSSREDVIDVIGGLVASENYLYAVRLTGEFDWVRTRTAARQSKPYPPLREATRGEPVVQFDHVAGTVSGFRTPLYEQGIGVPGGHVHFLDKNRERGGHVLDYRLRSGGLEICIGTDLHLSLPLTAAFGHAHLAPDDLAEQVQQTENHR
jgi:acetolactate decarboxylase